jgi:hypothetical protein
MFCFDWICTSWDIKVFGSHHVLQTAEHDTKGSSDATETDTEETSCDSKGEEESVPMEEAKTGEAGDGGKLIPAFEVVSKARLNTREPSRLDKCEYTL